LGLHDQSLPDLVETGGYQAVTGVRADLNGTDPAGSVGDQTLGVAQGWNGQALPAGHLDDGLPLPGGYAFTVEAEGEALLHFSVLRDAGTEVSDWSVRTR